MRFHVPSFVLGCILAGGATYAFVTQPLEDLDSNQHAEAKDIKSAANTVEPQPVNKYWVTSDRLNRRTCPATKCGIVGQLFFREGAILYEEQNGWGRISRHYDGSCRNGKSEYVDAGNASCTADNGIEGGKFAEWVFLQHLSTTRPPDPGAGTEGIAKAVSQSDDFRNHKNAFVKASKDLMASGKCALNDFEDMGGWVKSTTTYRDEPIYFTYCGGMTRANRIYLNVESGRTFK